ncbi:MAG TPA: lactate racemase domain-containing protein [Actinomycetota bacterium]|nr:lactate racemase domain-containing protein [Actinomycetota bacterium]
MTRAHGIVFGDRMIDVSLPETAAVVPPGLSLPLDAVDDLEAEVCAALDHPIDLPPLAAAARRAERVTVAFDDPTVPCYAPVWATGLPLIASTLEAAGVADDRIDWVCANSLHRRFTHDEIAGIAGDDFVRRHHERIRCHDAEDAERMVHLGRTRSGWDVVLDRSVVDSDLVVYLNCSTTRGFSGGWKSVCVGLSSYRSIHHHHTPDIMSMSLDRNRMHAMLDEMGELVEQQLGRERIFKIETVLANPFSVHRVLSGTTGACRARALEIMRVHQPARRDLLDEPVDVVAYGVPDWSPYAAYSHTNPILDLISTGLGYLGGMIQALGKPGCTVVLATPCPMRWNETHHPSYREAWERILPETKDPDEARARFEPEFAARRDYIDGYRYGNAFHPVHAVMALYPLKRLRHAARVIVAGAEDPEVPRHCGFETTVTFEEALEEAGAPDASVALVDYPFAVNRA